MGHLCHKFRVIEQNNVQQLTNKIIGNQCMLMCTPTCVLIMHNETWKPSSYIGLSVGVSAI
jgi:hypothetical protein